MVREPIVSGTFYPSNPKRLKSMLESFFGKEYVPNLSKLMPPPTAVIVPPHAGYIYSGETAAKAYKKSISRR